jgi:hypothetical protein
LPESRPPAWRLAAAVRRYAAAARRPWRYAAGEPSPAVRAAADHFTAAEPELTRLAHGRLIRLGVRDPDRREEHVQNAIALTWHAFRSDALRKGLPSPELLRPMLWYSVKHALAGRQLPGLVTQGIGAPPPGTIGVHESLSQPHGAAGELTHLFTPERVVGAEDARESFLATLSPRNRAMAEALMAGEPPSAVADRHGVGRSTISQFRNWLWKKYEEHVGEPPELPREGRTFGEGGATPSPHSFSRLAAAVRRRYHFLH